VSAGSGTGGSVVEGVGVMVAGVTTSERETGSPPFIDGITAERETNIPDFPNNSEEVELLDDMEVVAVGSTDGVGVLTTLVLPLDPETKPRMIEKGLPDKSGVVDAGMPKDVGVDVVFAVTPTQDRYSASCIVVVVESSSENTQSCFSSNVGSNMPVASGIELDTTEVVMEVVPLPEQAGLVEQLVVK
jgi:hypothetical protein